MRKVLLLGALLTLVAPGSARAGGDWTWPVVGPVIRGFDPPDTPFGPGHRGIDIAAAVGTPVVAAEAGVVTFAGPVGGRLFVTIDHGDGVESTYSFLSAIVARRGTVVGRGEMIARSGSGHAGEPIPHLHVGVKLDDVYVDPLDYLGPLEIWRFIRLAPLVVGGPPAPLL